MILQAHALTIGYSDQVVGRGLDVNMAAGEVLALLGPNGGGKTTLLKTLLGLVPPLAGHVLVGGTPLRRLSARERARILAYVPQVHASAFAFTVGDVVLMGRSASGSLFSPPSTQDREIAAESIARLGIAHLAERPYTLISGGERQLALIARALSQQPRIVLLDEPTASLDFGNQGRVMREIRTLAASGLAVIFSTHDPNHALRHADRAMLMRDGACLSIGPCRETLTSESLRTLYRCDIATVEDADGKAFLPA